MKWKTEQRKIDDLIPHETNPRRLTDQQAADLKASLQRFDLAEIPAINTNNKILAGHQRLKTMQLLGRGDEIIDVRVPDRELTADEEREYLIRSNKNTGEWDMDMLQDSFELDALTDWGFDEGDLGSFDVEGIDPPELADGDKEPFQQMTFTLHDEQAEMVKQAIDRAKQDGHGESAVNENSNGNALAWICRAFNGGRNG